MVGKASTPPPEGGAARESCRGLDPLVGALSAAALAPSVPRRLSHHLLPARIQTVRPRTHTPRDGTANRPRHPWATANGPDHDTCHCVMIAACRGQPCLARGAHDRCATSAGLNRCQLIHYEDAAPPGDLAEGSRPLDSGARLARSLPLFHRPHGGAAGGRWTGRVTLGWRRCIDDLNPSPAPRRRLSLSPGTRTRAALLPDHHPRLRAAQAAVLVCRLLVAQGRRCRDGEVGRRVTAPGLRPRRVWPAGAEQSQDRFSLPPQNARDGATRSPARSHCFTPDRGISVVIDLPMSPVNACALGPEAPSSR